MPYNPEGPVAKQFTPLLVNELTSTFNIPDDAQDTADYINMMIAQNRSASEICAEVKEVVNIPIDEAFMGRVFEEIGRLESLQNQPVQEQQPQVPQQPHITQQSQQQPQQPPQQPEQQNFLSAQQEPQQQGLQSQPELQSQQIFQQQQQQQQVTPQAPAASVNNAVFPQPSQSNPFQAMPTPSVFSAPTGPAGSAFSNSSNAPSTTPSFPTGPQGQSKKDAHVNFSKSSTDFKRGGGVGKGNRVTGKGSGISKDYVSNNGKTQKKSFGMQNAANLQKALALASSDSINMQPFTPRPPKGRCPDFPHCKNRECPLAHPTKKCFAYPNCPNPPGACDYLHPSEDGDLMKELEKTKQEYFDRKNSRFAAPQVTLCKYGILCSKELCPFGHPTPANRDAKVIIPKWCRENKNCQNPSCEYAHSSPNYQAPAPAPAPMQKPSVPKFAPQQAYNRYAKRNPTTLEQCKFGLSCTNQSCPKRHATSSVACRAGYNCTRMDCTFNHPVYEDCRFGNECKNKTCYFKHPDGREAALFGGQPGQQTMDRPFAVAEDQVMEQATQI